MRLHYPLDDVIRNKGKLTLLQLEYCDLFSYLLKLILTKVNKPWDKDEKCIPDKAELLQDMKTILTGKIFV